MNRGGYKELDETGGRQLSGRTTLVPPKVILSLSLLIELFHDSEINGVTNVKPGSIAGSLGGVDCRSRPSLSSHAEVCPSADGSLRSPKTQVREGTDRSHINNLHGQRYRAVTRPPIKVSYPHDRMHVRRACPP